MLERKEQSLTAKEKNIDTEKAQLQELQAKHLQELERISGLTSDQAKEQLLSAVKEDVKHELSLIHILFCFERVCFIITDQQWRVYNQFFK